MHNALLHHLLTNAQPVSEQWQPLPTPLPGSSPSFIVQHDATCLRHPFGHLVLLSWFSPLSAPSALPAPCCGAASMKN